MNTYRGNYDIFERTREEQLKNQLKAFESHEKARSHMQVLNFYLFFFFFFMGAFCAHIFTVFLLRYSVNLFLTSKNPCCRPLLTSSATMQSVHHLFNQESRYLYGSCQCLSLLIYILGISHVLNLKTEGHIVVGVLLYTLFDVTLIYLSLSLLLYRHWIGWAT